MRILIAGAAVASMTGLTFAQTQPTRPSAYATAPTMPSAFATAAINPCYWGRSREHDFAFFYNHSQTHFYNGRRYRWSSFNPTSPCYTGTSFPSYSAIEPYEFPNAPNRRTLPGADSLNGDQAEQRIEEKGYLNVSALQKDNHGIWRGRASLKDGRPVAVVLDLAGNIYSELSPSITIRPLKP